MGKYSMKESSTEVHGKDTCPELINNINLKSLSPSLPGPVLKKKQCIPHNLSFQEV